jgi:predicted nuclease with RNAse H fold
MIVGIDYGSKLAGTTVLCYSDGTGLTFLQSEKKKDADAFLTDKINELQPSAVYIDAPLSLPLGFFEKESSEYFYRAADKELSAMSPMFLGGLTARAVRLKDQLSQFSFYEAYPGALARRLNLNPDQYKKSSRYIDNITQEVIAHLEKVVSANYTIQDGLNNWHQVDALLALVIGFRHQNGIAEELGDRAEGVILV